MENQEKRDTSGDGGGKTFWRKWVFVWAQLEIGSRDKQFGGNRGTVEGNERRGTWKTTRCRFESNDRRSRTLWSWDFSVRAIGTKKLF